MRVINGQQPYRLPERLGVHESPSEPLIRGATGGEVRRSCLSPQGEFCAGRPL